MATKTITGKVTGPDGSNKGGAVITATLSQPCVITGTQEVVGGRVVTTTATDGTYTLTLQANNDLTPTGTFYTVTESTTDGGFYSFTIVVPQTAGPFVMSSIQTNPPTASPTPSHVSTLTVDNAAAFTNGPVTVGNLPVRGRNVVIKTSGYTASDGDVVLANATSGAIALTLPPVAAGIQVIVKKTDNSANKVTIAPQSGTIDGAANFVIWGQYHSVTFVSDGTNWYVTETRIMDGSGNVAAGSLTASSGPYTPDPNIAAGGLTVGGIERAKFARYGVDGSDNPIVFDNTPVLKVKANPTYTTTVQPGFWVSDDLGGAPNSGQVFVNEVVANTDSMDLTGVPSGGGTLFYVGHTLSAGAKGARNTFLAAFNQVGATTASPSNLLFYVALAGNATAAASAGGVAGAGNQLGNLFGANQSSLLKTGAGLYWNSLVGEEIDVGVQTGTGVLDKIGTQIVQLSTDAVAGSRTDAGLLLTAQVNNASLPGWTVGMAFGGPNGWWPIKSTGTLIGTYAAVVGGGPAMRAANGVDLSAITFTGAAFKSTGFAVDPNGVLKLGVAGSAFIDNVSAGQSLVVRNNNGAVTLATFDGATSNVIPGQHLILHAGNRVDVDAAGALNVGTVNANVVNVGNAGAPLNYNYAVTALGGGAAPTLGTIGGSGPTSAAQNSWMQIQIGGTNSWIPIWR